MENASKALIIAGATLIAVLLISLAMWFLNALRDYNSDVANQEKMTEIEAFNRFFIYSRPNDGLITGSEMINIIGKAVDYNAIYQDVDHYVEIHVSGIKFSGASLPSFSSTLPLAGWNKFIEDVGKSSDTLLWQRRVRYNYEYDPNVGRVYKINFSKG